MKYPIQKILSILLILCVLVVGGLAQAQSAEHSGHHAQHQAATHGTVLCSWMCAAGTVLDTAITLIQAERSPVAILPLPISTNSCSEPPLTFSGRGPPLSTL
jgi:hypothetical protein